jgi:sugar-specific transcriptional regulator TrmB/predicted hydrocarbon binding protein
MRFAALPPERLLDRWISTATDELDRLRRGRETLLTEWRESLAVPTPYDTRKFAVLEGQDTIHAFLRKRLASARREVGITASGFSLARAIEGGIDRALKDAHERGVRATVVTEISRANLAEAKQFASFVDLRHAIGPVTNRAVLVDRTGALVFVSGEQGLGANGEEQVALWSTAPRFVTLARDYHRRFWARARPADERIQEIENPSPGAVLSVRRGRESAPLGPLQEIAEIGMRATGLSDLPLDVPELVDAVARQVGRRVAENVVGSTPEEVARSLAEFYDRRAMGRLSVVKDRPLTLRVTNCFACTRASSPEVGRALCPAILRTVLEARLGAGWEVSHPDPRRHATRGCIFCVTPS